MIYPPFLSYDDEHEYRSHWIKHYCQSPLFTFDQIAVRFRKDDFEHAFFESIQKKDDTFSRRRAERMNWIKIALIDPKSEKFCGWNKKIKKYDNNRRVVIVMINYVVVIAITDVKKASFITAYLADTVDNRGRYSTIEKIRLSPKWE